MDGINAFLSSAPTQFIGRSCSEGREGRRGCHVVGQQFMQGGQQYVQRFQEKIGVLSGSVLNYHFAISNEYGHPSSHSITLWERWCSSEEIGDLVDAVFEAMELHSAAGTGMPTPSMLAIVTAVHVS